MDGEKFEVWYLYRDAGNNKFRGSFVVRGRLDLESLKRFFFDRAWFVPECIELPALRPAEPSKEDHWLHEIEEITPYCGPVEGIPARKLTRRIIEVGERDGWLERASFFG
jgi:hypothetical protein